MQNILLWGLFVDLRRECYPRLRLQQEGVQERAPKGFRELVCRPPDRQIARGPVGGACGIRGHLFRVGISSEASIMNVNSPHAHIQSLSEGGETQMDLLQFGFFMSRRSFLVACSDLQWEGFSALWLASIQGIQVAMCGRMLFIQCWYWEEWQWPYESAKASLILDTNPANHGSRDFIQYWGLWSGGRSPWAFRHSKAVLGKFLAF